MKRRGLGRGLGKGYYNLIPVDSYIHSLSAKGIKSKPVGKVIDYTKLDAKQLTLLAENRFSKLTDEQLVSLDDKLILDRTVSGRPRWFNRLKFNQKLVDELKRRDLVETRKGSLGIEEIRLKEDVLSFPRDEVEDILGDFTEESTERLREQELGLGTPSLGSATIRGTSATLGLGFFPEAVATIPALGLSLVGLTELMRRERKRIAKEIKRQVEEDRQLNAKIKNWRKVNKNSWKNRKTNLHILIRKKYDEFEEKTYWEQCFAPNGDFSSLETLCYSFPNKKEAMESTINWMKTTPEG